MRRKIAVSCALVGAIGVALCRFDVSAKSASPKNSGGKNTGGRSPENETGAGEASDRSERWKNAVAPDAISKHGLPDGRLYLLLRKRKTGELRELLGSLPKKAGDEQERMMWLAACMSSAQQYDRAVKIFDQIPNLENAPNVIVFRAAKAYAAEQKLDKGIALSSSVLKRWEMPDAFRVRVQCYVLQNRYDLAVNDYIALADLEKRSERVHLMRAANLLVKMGKPDRALALMDKAEKVPGEKGLTGVYLVEGNCYKSMNRWSDAKKCFDRAIDCLKAKKPSKDDQLYWPVCYKERAICYDNLGKPDLARADRAALSQLSKSMENDLIGE